MNRTTTKVLFVAAVIFWLATRLLWWDAVGLDVITSILLYALIILLALIPYPLQLWDYRSMQAVCLAGLSVSFGGIASAVVVRAREEIVLSKKLMLVFSLAWMGFLVLAWLHQWLQGKKGQVKNGKAIRPDSASAIFMPMSALGRVALLCTPTIAAQFTLFICLLLF